ncbi:IclR family transcriptional regulator [Streptomyces fuscigenes]|uniref:IclR family transcriptional regulator n=1 Tax=Streptomyces fuscigenes TaxID=1528880 RepID=UPI001F29EC01|nr:IclR family transcriptional regulator [Streptomyces fuscigenes]MCF3961894.1 IclR family transcriptional regulator [Streptomyces fuscigenes]
MARARAGGADGTAGTGPAYPIASVDNALRLLLMFRDRRRLRLSEAARDLGVADSTAHRLLAMLIHHGFVRREDGDRGYAAGPALLEIGLAAVRGLDIRSVAGPVLDDLARQVDETVHLAQLEGGRIRYLAGAESGRALRVADRTGLLMPAHRTATGKALLAQLTPAQLDELYPVAVAEDSPAGLTVPEREALDAELAQVTERGYADNVRDREIVSLAVVVRNGRGAAIAALNASAPATRMDGPRRAEVVEHLRTAAARLEDLLSGALG